MFKGQYCNTHTGLVVVIVAMTEDAVTKSNYEKNSTDRVEKYCL